MGPRTAFTERFGLAAPIVSAPMAAVAGGLLASAVSRAGGLGFIGGGYGDRAWLEQELDAAGDAGIGVGFITWALKREPALLDLVLERRPRAVFLSFGDLRPFADRVLRAGVPLVAQVQGVADARLAVGQGATVIVAQGAEAGGHSGRRSTMALVPAVVDVAGRVPVLAAGGIADGRGLAAALMLGADGVVCGTAFYATHESLAHHQAKTAAVAACGDQTVKSNLFDRVRGYEWPAPWQLRTLRNAFYERWGSRELTLMQDLEAHQRAYAMAQRAGAIDTAAVIVGEAIDMVREICSAGEVVRDMSRVARGLLGWDTA